MNWLHFLLGLTAIYVIYYVAAITFDLLKTGNRVAGKSLTGELSFRHEHTPQKMEHEQVKKVQPGIISSGGVSLRDLFTLSRQDAIIYTSQVSY